MKYQKLLRLGLYVMAFAINVHAQKIGEKVAFDDSEWTVVSARNAGSAVEPKSPFGKSATTEGNFIFVVYKVKNTTKREKSILVTPVLVDSESREFNPYRHQANYLDPSAETITLEALPANIPKTYHAMYEVPAESKGLKFQVRSLSIMTEYKLVSLGFDEEKDFKDAKIAFEQVRREIDYQEGAKYGGIKWKEMLKQGLIAQSSFNSLEERMQSYKAALALLPSAREEVTENKRLLQVAALTASREAKNNKQWTTCSEKAKEVLLLDPSNTEADTLLNSASDALKAEVTENKRLLLVAALNAARDANSNKQWMTCSEKAKEVLLLDPSNAEAGTLMNSASNELKDAAIAAALTTAQEAKDNKQWQVCVKKIKEVLALDSKNTVAMNLSAFTAELLIPGEAWKSPAAGIEFVWIPALKIWVGKYEVTNSEYRKKEPAHDSDYFQANSLNGERQPVVQVNFQDAVAYAAWLTERDKAQLGGMRYRVPWETEWKSFAQCGDNREYPWGNAMPPTYGNYVKTSEYDDGDEVTCLVEKSGKNDWGLYGIGGNALECCAADASASSFGAWRGASWRNIASIDLRCTWRIGFGGSDRSDDGGFRLVLSR